MNTPSMPAAVPLLEVTGLAKRYGDAPVFTDPRGTSTVSYMGQTYYVCCTGCRDEFNANPTKYIDEYKAKQAKKKK